MWFHIYVCPYTRPTLLGNSGYIVSHEINIIIIFQDCLGYSRYFGFLCKFQKELFNCYQKKKKACKILIETIFNLQFNLGRSHLLTIVNFYLFSFSLISLCHVLSFSVYWSYTCFIKFILQGFIFFNAMLNGTFIFHFLIAH